MEPAKLQLLHEMGITVYQSRSNMHFPTTQILISAAECDPQIVLSDEKAQLRDKMLAALKWSNETNECVTCSLHESWEGISDRWQWHPPKQVIVFGKKLAAQLGLPYGDAIIERASATGMVQVITIESLAVLLKDIQAKKAAWKTMQLLMR